MLREEIKDLGLHFHPDIYYIGKYIFLIIKLRKNTKINQESPGKTKNKEMSLALAHIKTYYKASESRLLNRQKYHRSKQ